MNIILFVYELKSPEYTDLTKSTVCAVSLLFSAYNVLWYDIQNDYWDSLNVSYVHNVYFTE